MKAMTDKLLLSVCTLLLLGSCGGDGDISLADYVDQVNTAANAADRSAQELMGEALGIVDPTPSQLQGGLERGLAEIRVPLQDAIDEITPPDQLTAFHTRMWGWHADFIAIEQALADRVGTTEDTAQGWEGLSGSPEMASYRAALAEGKQICNGFQDELDAIAELGVFADTPWMPSELNGVAEAALGCQWFPDRPDDVYRYPPVPAP